VKLHVESHGRGRDIVLLHGWAMHGGAWSEVVERLQGRYRLHAVDLPGHGASGECLPGSFDEAVALVASHVPDGAVVCGWSFGGLVAQRLVRMEPRRVSALILVSTSPCFVERADWHDAMKPATLASFSAGLERDRERTLRDFVQLNALHGARGREAVRAFSRRLADHGAPGVTALQATLAWLAHADLRPDAAAIEATTLVIHGARDALAPIGAGRWLASEIRGARLLELADAAHLPFFTHREAFVDALESFLA
jgi:pimeloyl-[acyl-carrier protein] methyl ester esterase